MLGSEDDPIKTVVWEIRSTRIAKISRKSVVQTAPDSVSILESHEHMALKREDFQSDDQAIRHSKTCRRVLRQSGSEYIDAATAP